MLHSSKFLLTCTFVCLAFSLMAQPGNPTSPAPFGFTELLIGAGLIYGGRKLKKAKSEKAL